MLELGRMTWAAMALEEAVYGVCRVVKPRHGPYDDHPIGARIDEAVTDLDAYDDAALQERTRQWLLAAKAALEARNSVLHSTHVVFWPLPGTTPVPETTGQPPAQRRQPLDRQRRLHLRLLVPCAGSAPGTRLTR